MKPSKSPPSSQRPPQARPQSRAGWAKTRKETYASPPILPSRAKRPESPPSDRPRPGDSMLDGFKPADFWK